MPILPITSSSTPSLPLCSSTKELKPSNELSVEEICRTKAQILPPMERREMYKGFAYTAPLIELFQFRIDKFDDNERRGELYGKIEVVDCTGSHTLYNRDRSNSEHIHANSTISLVGPYRSIDQLDGIAINIDLSFRAVKDVSDSSEDDFVLSKWQFSWDDAKPEVAHIRRGKFLRDFFPDDVDVTCKHQPAGYDQPLKATFEGPNGSCLTMSYAILKHAVQAWIKVEVVDVEVVPTPVEYSVRGSIFAKYDLLEKENELSIFDCCKTPLLKTSNPESVKVERWKEIQLSRWIVAVPAYSSLVIEADLWDISSHLKVGKGKVEFIPSHQGYAVDYIRGDDNFALRIMLCWSFGSVIPDKFPFYNRE